MELEESGKIYESVSKFKVRGLKYNEVTEVYSTFAQAGGLTVTVKSENSRKIQDKDIKILKCIEEDGSCNLDEISRLTNISRSTIHYRLKKFRKMGLIKGTFAELDPQVLGLDITTVTFVNVSYDSGTAEEIGEKLASISGVFTVYYVLGDFDFIVIAKAKDKEDLKRILREIHAIDGVVKTGTHFVASTIKEEKRLLVNYNEEDLKRLFCGEK